MPRPENTPEILWSKVNKKEPNECWPWNGWKNEKGYGRTEIKDVAYYAHRVIFDLVNPGLISLKAPKSCAEKGFVLHRCDNPSCCNPGHLFIGTHLDNMRDKVAKGRSPHLRGVNGVRSKLTEHDVREIRRMKKEGATKKALALLYEVSEATISGACYGRYYQDVI